MNSKTEPEFKVNIDQKIDFTILNFIYSDGNITLSFTPENPTEIEISDTGRFDCQPSNGSFSLYWNKDYYIFECGKYGDGQGGTMTFKINNTESLKESFNNALIEWNKHIH